MDLFVFFLIIMVIVLVFLGIAVIYQLFYKRQINRKLNGEVTKLSLVDSFHFILIVFIILILVILIILIRTNGKINDLEDDLVVANHNIRELERTLGYTNSRAASILNKLEQMEQEAKWIQAKDYEFVEITEDHNQVITNIKFDLKEINPQETIHLFMTNKEDSNDTIKIEVQPENYTYQSTVNLDRSKNYKVEIISESPTSIKKETLFDINVKIDLNNEDILGDLMAFYDSEYDKLRMEAILLYKHGGFDSLKMKEVKLRTTKDGNEFITDITNSDSTRTLSDHPDSTRLELEFHLTGLDNPGNYKTRDTFQFIIIDQSGNEYRSRVITSADIENR